jgi:hypothetical protein
MRAIVPIIALHLLVSSIELSASEPNDRPIDLKPYQEFTADFARWLEKADAKKIIDSFDPADLVSRALKGTTLDDLQKFRAAIQVKRFIGKYPEMIAILTGKEGSYKLLRVRVHNGEVRAIWRLIGGGGMNYHEMVLKLRNDGSVGIADIYIAASAEFLSDLARRTLLQGELGEFLIKGGKEPREITEGVRKVPSLVKLIAAGQSQEALQIWDTLPDALKKERNFQLIRVTAAAGLIDQPDLYLRIFEEFQKKFP